MGGTNHSVHMLKHQSVKATTNFLRLHSNFFHEPLQRRQCVDFRVLTGHFFVIVLTFIVISCSTNL